MLRTGHRNARDIYLSGREMERAPELAFVCVWVFVCMLKNIDLLAAKTYVHTDSNSHFLAQVDLIFMKLASENFIM